MKIEAQHYEHMRGAILSVFTQSKLDTLRQSIKESGRFKDFDKRVRWDMLFLSLPAAWVCDNLYAYADDAHIDTALRKILAENFD